MTIVSLLRTRRTASPVQNPWGSTMLQTVLNGSREVVHQLFVSIKLSIRFLKSFYCSQDTADFGASVEVQGEGRRKSSLFQTRALLNAFSATLYVLSVLLQQMIKMKLSYRIWLAALLCPLSCVHVDGERLGKSAHEAYTVSLHLMLKIQRAVFASYFFHLTHSLSALFSFRRSANWHYQCRCLWILLPR